MTKININNYEAFLLDFAEGNLSDAEQAELRVFVVSHPELEIDLDDVDFPVLTTDNFPIEDMTSLKKSYLVSDEENIIAYVENILSPNDRAVLEGQIAADPTLADLLKAYQSTLLIPDAVSFSDKVKLLRSEEELLVDGKLIAYFEDKLYASEKITFEKQLIASAQLRSDLGLLEKTILKADLNIVYPNKARLKKKGRVIALFSYRSLGVAAAAAVLLLVGFTVLFDFNSEIKPVKPVAVVEKGQSANENPAESIPKETRASSQQNVAQHKQTITIGNAVKQKQHAPSSDVKSPVNFAQTTTASVITETQSAQKLNQPEVKQNENPTLLAQIVPSENRSSIAGANHFESLDELTAVEELPEMQLVETKKGIWQRAVNLARNANKLGLTAVNGEDEGNNRAYKISLSSFSIEKK